MSTIELTADTTELSELLGELLSYFSDAPHDIRKLALDFLDVPFELVSFELGVTSGAVVTALLKPSQRLLDLRLAVRTRNFDLLLVKHSHGEPSK